MNSLYRIVKVSNYPEIYSKAWEYLLSFEEINRSIINKHLNDYKEDNPESLEDLLYAILDSVKNRQGMPNAIGKLENIEPYLCDFSPTKIIKEYNNDWKRLFLTVQNKEVDAIARKKRRNIYCRSETSF